MSDLDDRSGGRRKGLFRRNRSEAFEPAPDWDPAEWGDPVEQFDAPESDLAARPRRRTTGEMFAQREQGWTDAWGDDAWDDEWRDPAFRRPSIPSVVDPRPQEVDAWLEEGAEEWSDVTRETALRWGGSDEAGTPAAPTGTTWADDEPDPQVVSSTPADLTVAEAQLPLVVELALTSHAPLP